MSTQEKNQPAHQHNEIDSLRRRISELETELAAVRQRLENGNALEQRYRSMLETANEGIWSFDKDFRTVFVNPQISEMLGYSSNELLGRPFTDFLLEEDLADHDLQAAQRRLGHSGRYERRLLHKDGSIRWTAISATPLKNNGNGFEGSFAMLTDISERKQAERILRESELRYRMLFDAAGDAILLLKDGIIFDINRRTEDLFGGPRDRFIGISPSILSPAEQPDGSASDQKSLQCMQQALQEGSCRFEWRHCRLDGTPLDCEVTLSKVNILGEPYLLGLVRDISARKRQEAILRKQEEEFRAIFETADDAIYIKDASLRYTRVNPAMERLHGKTAALIVGKTDFDIFDPELAAHIVSVDNRVLMGETVSEESVRRFHGEKRTFHIAKAPMRGDNGRVIGICAIARDITERRQAEEAIRESRERYKTISEVISDFAFAYRLDDNARFVREWTTESLEAMTGYSLEERDAQGGPLSPLPPAERDAVMSEIQAMLTDLQPRTFECHTKTKAGDTLWLRCRLRPVWDEQAQRILRIVGAGQDITALKTAEENRERLETQVQQAQKLESLGVLAGGIAHDFNNMLMTILGNADLALLDLSPAHASYDCLRSIETAARRAAELCRQMLAYSGRGKFLVQKLNLNDLIHEMSHLLEVSIAKNVVLRYDLAQQLPMVEADATQMRQIVMNLITNASESIGEKSGIVSLKTNVMECTADYLRSTFIDDNFQEGRYVFFEISDNGCGMPKDVLQKVFDPFYTTKFTGRGLGLAAVLGIVRGHRGAVKVYSEVGRGSTFKILLPALDAQGIGHDHAAPEPNREEAWRGSGTILLVDDEETVRTLGKRMLERIGFSVLLASDGREAIDLFKMHCPRIDGVVLDLTMPHMDGETTFRELRRIHPHVRVIISSGYTEQEVTTRFAGKGLAGFIQKPYQFAVLRDAMRALLEK